MKINKIICDVCNKEIDVNADAGLAMYEHIKVQQKLDIVPNFFSKGTEKLQAGKEIVKSSFDLCKDCAKETEDFFTRLKEDKTVTKVEKKQ